MSEQYDPTPSGQEPPTTIAETAARIAASMGLEGAAATAATAAITQLAADAAQAAITKAKFFMQVENQRNDLTRFANRSDYLAISQVLEILEKLTLPTTLPYQPDSFRR